MRHLIAIVVALSIVFASLAWAGDRHEEALTGQHVSVDQESDSGNLPSDISVSCDHCCHGSSHYVALRDGDVVFVAIDGGTVPPLASFQPDTWASSPPTPPPSS